MDANDLRVAEVMMMRVSALLYGLILILMITGCASAPPPGTPVTHDTACTAENHDKRVSIEGYPRLPHDDGG
jgi:hypothetical protein